MPIPLSIARMLRPLFLTAKNAGMKSLSPLYQVSCLDQQHRFHSQPFRITRNPDSLIFLKHCLID